MEKVVALVDRAYSGLGVVRLIAERETKKEALLAICDTIYAYVDSDSVEENDEEREDAGEEPTTFEDLVEIINDSNGDGADCILSLTDAEGKEYITGDMIYERVL